MRTFDCAWSCDAAANSSETATDRSLIWTSGDVVPARGRAAPKELENYEAESGAGSTAGALSGLLVAQGLDRIELCRPPRRPDAECNADECGEEEGNDHRAQRHRRVE